jgi:TRAP-type C4-dicarboxylate transport system substrate-binding protein
MAIAGIMIRRDAFERLTPAQQKVVTERALAMEQELNTNSSLVNQKSMRAMVAGGLKTVVPSQAFLTELQQVRAKVWAVLQGNLYQPADLKKVQALITLCRNTSCR